MYILLHNYTQTDIHWPNEKAIATPKRASGQGYTHSCCNREAT